MGFFGRLLLGNGTLDAQLKSELEGEGLVALEEGVSGSVRYNHFKSPGRRFHGKITPERFGLGLSERRFAVYCKSGRVKLIDTPYANPLLAKLDVSVDDKNRLALVVDYDADDEPSVSGQITIVLAIPNAATIAEQLRSRVAAD